jgi:hypothetical protein
VACALYVLQVSNESWYVHEEGTEPGLITDFAFRADPKIYPRRARRLIPALGVGFFLIPALVTLLVYATS